MKAVNSHLTDEFHAWRRRALPGRFVIQDLDAWALLVSDPRPRALFELKRGGRDGIEVERWEPFGADRPNYTALLHLARSTGIPLWALYYRAGPFDDESPVHLYELTETEPDYAGRQGVYRAGDWAECFDYFLAPAEVAA